jgi:hypothetical protein
MRLGRAAALGSITGMLACAVVAGLEDVRFEEDREGGLESGMPDVKVEAVEDVDADAPRAPTCAERYDAGDAAHLLFCDDFERSGSPVDGWKAAVEEQGGTLTLSTAFALSGTKSLRADVPAPASASNKRAYMTTPTVDNDGGAFPIFLELDYLVDIAPLPDGFPTNGFVFASFSTPTAPVNYFAIGVTDAGLLNPTILGVGGRVDELPLRQWHHVKIRVDQDAIRMDVFPAGGGLPIVRTAARVNDAVTDFWVGVDRGSGSDAVRAFVDDVVVHR